MKKIYSDVILGIDLGRIDLCKTILKNEKVEIVPHSEGRKIIVLMVCYKKDNDIYFYMDQ